MSAREHDDQMVNICHRVNYSKHKNVEKFDYWQEKWKTGSLRCTIKSACSAETHLTMSLITFPHQNT